MTRQHEPRRLGQPVGPGHVAGAPIMLCASARPRFAEPPNMTFEQLMLAAGLTARTYQRDLAEQVGEHLAPGTPIAVGVQATTGVGKAWALAHNALEAARAGRRVIWSTHTTL